MDLDHCLLRLGGAARTGTLLRAGVPERAIRRAVAEGTVLRPGHGVVARPGADPEVLAAVLHSGYLTCLSAARHYGLWILRPPEVPHLYVRTGAARTGAARTVTGAAGHVSHRSAATVFRGGLPVVALPDALVHLLRCQPGLAALVSCECAVQRRLVTRGDLLARLPGSRNARLRAMVAGIRTDAESPLEIVARELFRRAGLKVEAQVRIRGLGRVDLLVEGFLIVELDGFAFHADRAAFREDRRRNNTAALHGLPTLRYLYEDVVFGQERILAEVIEVLRTWPGRRAA